MSTAVIEMTDKVERLADTVKTQQQRIEDLTLRAVRLEAALEIAPAAQGLHRPSPSTASALEKPEQRPPMPAGRRPCTTNSGNTDRWPS